jgi:hypothetical protein
VNRLVAEGAQRLGHALMKVLVEGVLAYAAPVRKKNSHSVLALPPFRYPTLKFYGFLDAINP